MEESEEVELASLGMAKRGETFVDEVFDSVSRCALCRCKSEMEGLREAKGEGAAEEAGVGALESAFEEELLVDRLNRRAIAEGTSSICILIRCAKRLSKRCAGISSGRGSLVSHARTLGSALGL